MATVEPILVSIQADVSQLKAGLAQAEASLKGLDGTVKNATSGFGQMTGKLKQLGAAVGLAFASQQVVQFGKDVIMAASNMNESLSKVNVVFGEGSAAVEKFATDAAKNLGMSKQAALEASGTYGNLFQAFGLGQQESQKMSTSLVQLAGDLASFNNTSVDDAILALRSGLSGETEPLKKFGVALSDARLKTEAMALGLIKSTSDALTPAAKAQASYSLILKDTTLAQGDYARTSDGTANKMKTLKAEMDNAKASLGAGLLPVFNALLSVLKPAIQLLGKLGSFMANNKEAVTAFTIVLAAGTIAWGAYTAVVKAAIIQQKIFNLVSKLNPIGLIITAVALLAAGLVMLWKRSETFRNVIISVGKAGVTAMSFIIGVVGDLVTGMMKLVTGPMRLLLKGLSLLGVKQAGTALKEINGVIDTTGKFFDSAAAKVKGLTDKLDQLGKKKAEVEKVKTVAKKTVEDAVDPNAKKAADKAAKEEAKRLDKLKGYTKDVEDIYKDMNDAIADANDDMLDAQKDRDEAIADANKRYSETVANLNKRYSEALADAQLRYDDAEADARKNYAKALADNAKDYANKVLDIEEKLQEKISDLREKALSKSADLNKAASEKQASIVQQSMDRLRNAFSSAINLDNAIKGASPKNMIKQLQDTLNGAKKLQQNAAALAGMGYSQTFIEQVVKNGPRMGNRIAEALKNSSPEATKELQALYGEVETISTSGMDQLAQTMNSGGKLATQELMDAYKKVATDLKASLSEVDQELNKSLAEAHTEYRRAMADAQAASMERIAEAKARMDESLADALVTLTRSRAEAKKQLDEGLAEAQKTLTESLAETQKKYGEAIDKINKDTQAKIADLKLKLAEVAALMASLGAQQAAAAAMANAPTFVNIPGGTGSSGTPFGQAGGTVTNNNVSVTGYNLTSPAATGATVSNQLKYGSTVNTTTLAGILAASAPKATTPTPLTSAQIVANRRAAQGGYL
jgi:hypothetical protein